MLKLKEKIFKSPSFVEFPLEKVAQIEIQLLGLTGSLKSFFVSFIAERINRPVLFLIADTDSAEKLYEDIQQISPELPVGYIPNVEQKPYEETTINPSLLQLKSEGLQNLIGRDKSITIITPSGLVSKTISPEQFIDNQIFLKKGKEIEFEGLIEFLVNSGYTRTDIVNDVGEISVRGGILDIYSWNYEEPVRLEFFGDTIESIRLFNVMTQRSMNELNEINILPNLINDELAGSIFDFIADNSIIIAENLVQFYDQIEEYLSIAEQNYSQSLERNVFHAEPVKKYLSLNEIESRLKIEKLLRLDLISDEKLFSYQFKSAPPPTFAANIGRFISFLNKSKKDAKEVYVQCESTGQAERLAEILEEEGLETAVKITSNAVHNGFLFEEINLRVLTNHEIFDRFKKRKTYKRFKNGEYLRSLKSLRLDDFVVHIDYGIGKYRGLEVIKNNNSKSECIKLEFVDGDNLYVSVDRLNRVQKYQTEGDGEPKITKLGSGEWERLKSKTKDSVQKIAAELLQLYAERKSQQGFAFSADSHWQKELEASFPYEETEDQITSINEVKKDLESSQPMDRLLCGDVGYGKTEVALRAAFKVINDGKQVALLVPTTILAYQHFQTFKERLTDFPINVDMLSRFRTRKSQKEAIEKLETGGIDLIIGTHRLLSDDVKFKDLGLLIIDEEQRFGVKHKEKLKMLRVTVDVLTMTATPIPRTMHLSLMGARDLSHIETPPRNRHPVITEIHEWDEDLIRQVISRELDRGGQVYFVHNRVRTIDGIKGIIESILPQAKIAVAHGQLPETKLEKIMMDFIHKKYNVLVSTMIIENGLDIPNVNSIIIDHADKFGLAQLYQLRGRVGRADKQAYAYLFIRDQSRLNDLARRRLKAIQDFTELGSGFRLALRDMEIRGVGNILGKEQSGYIQSVGFDLYCKIMEETVANLKNDMDIDETILDRKRSTDPKLDVDFDLIIPKEYIFNETERITIYHRLVNLTSTEEIDKLKDELTDRFGQIPFEVASLFEAIELKVLAGKIYSSRIILNKNYMKIFFAEEAQNDESFFTETIPRLMNQTMAKVQFINKPDSLGVSVKLVGGNRIEQLEFAKNILKYVV